MRVATAAVAVLFAVLAPSAALASGGLPAGVHVDPGSPSKHQYVIPVNAARAETSGGGHHGSGSGSQLFGSGINPGSSGSSANGGKGGANGNANGKSGSNGHSTYSLASSGRPPGTGGSSGSGGDGGSGWVPLVAGGAAVLLLGCGGGFALRRRILRA